MSNSPTESPPSARGFVPVAYLFSAIVSLAFGTIAAHATDYQVGSIYITRPWSSATPKGATTGAGYMSITNKGTISDQVNCLSSDASQYCQIDVVGGLEIKPWETIMLHPRGFHVMFVNLKHPLERGKTVKARLKFDNAGTVDVDYPIQ